MAEFYNGIKKEDITSKIDHTILKVGCTFDDVKKICDEAAKNKTASVCIPPCFVKEAKEYLCGKTAVCTVIGFPNGYSTTSSKVIPRNFAISSATNFT